MYLYKVNETDMKNTGKTYRPQGNIGLFNTFHSFLEEKGLVMKEGVIIDGSFVDVPRQRNTREENRQIKENKQTFKIKS